MKVVRSREERDYKSDGNRARVHKVTFALDFDSPRKDGTLTGDVAFRQMDGEQTVCAVNLRATTGRAGSNVGLHEKLVLDHRLNIDELVEFAEGLKTAAVLAQNLFKCQPPVRAARAVDEQPAHPI